MKKLLVLFALCCSMLFVFGCSGTSDRSLSPTEPASINIVERPQFVETRPQSVVDDVTLTIDLVPAAYKRVTPPPPPPVDTGADPNPNPAHKYAYVVGISDYEGTTNDLQFCDDDAIEMAAMLQAQGFTVRMDVDMAATADAITAGLEWLISNAVPGDEVAFCYSGHGSDPSAYGSCIISADLYYVTHTYAMSYFNAINCSKKLITLDACVIGDFHDDAVTGTLCATASTTTNSYDAYDL
ncbi:MAG: caspase family protein, partial [Alphaproteobacteria bacterium]|nr:caspase family protein [Alphaproteobacteria bacterium]